MFLLLNLNSKPANTSGVSVMDLPLLKIVGHTTSKAQCVIQLFSSWIQAWLDAFYYFSFLDCALSMKLQYL